MMGRGLKPGFYRLIQTVLLAITRGQMKSTFMEFLGVFVSGALG